MKTPNLPKNERERLDEIEAYQILDEKESDDFDFLTAMAAEICNTPIALISLITDSKQWFLSHHGLEVRETPKDFSFCAHAINQPEKAFIVEDAREDERFSDNPLTTDEPHVIFYAGIPLVNSNGFPLGSLCVIDNQPRKLTENQLTLLNKLARQVVNLLELRRHDLDLQQKNEALAQSNTILEIIQDANHIGLWELDITTGKTIWNDLVYAIHEVPTGYDQNLENALNFYHPDYHGTISAAVANAIEHHTPFDVICILITAKGNHKWVRSVGKRLGDKLIGSFQDITELKQRELKLDGIFNSAMTFIGFLNTEGVLLEANDTALKVGGVKKEDVIGKPFWECDWWKISKKTQEKLKRSFQKALSGKEVTYEVEINIANGKTTTILFSLRPVFDDQGKVVFIIPEGSPVEDLVKARDSFKNVLEGTNAGTWEWKVQSGETVFNERWAAIVGYTLQELEPITIDTWIKLAHPDDLEESNRRLQLCFDRKSEYYEMEARMKHKDGHWMWVLDRGKVIEWDAEGKPLKMFGTHQDITLKKQKEEQLRISEESFRGNFENAAIGMALLDEKGNWLKVNSEVCKMVGYTEEELLSLTFQDITHPEDLKIDLKLLNEVMNGERDHYQMEKRYLHKEGHVVYTILAVSLVRDADGHILYFISQIIDITHQKVQQLELEYQQLLLSNLFVSSPIGLALNDLETGAFLDVNEKLLEPTGYTKEEFLTLNYFDVTPKEYLPLENKALEQMKKKGGYDKFEKEYIRKDGSRYPVALRGVVIEDLRGKKLIWSYIQDISEEKEAERKLNEALNRLQAVLDASKQVAVVATDEEGVIKLFNAGAEAMLGYSAAEIIEHQTPEIIHRAEEIELQSRVLTEHYQQEIKGFDVLVHEAKIGLSKTKEWTYVRKDGIDLPVLLSVNSIKNGNNIIGYLGVATDISALKKVEQEIKSLLDITQEQNDRLRNFAHIVSHNLRSHSSGISGLLGLVELENPTLFENELFDMIRVGAKNLQQTVEDLTEVVRVNLNENEKIDISLHEVIEKNLQSLALSIKKTGISIYSSVSKELTLKGVPAYIDSIVLNFISNAIKYKSEERESYLNISAEKSTSHIVIQFQDNGLGIDLEKHGEKLFGMYKTFHRQEDSRGIGLFITKNQIESMGGKIEVDSKVNQGTTFRIALPI